MNLQDEIIARYNQQYPTATLKELARKTGIQITRVFRIMNGYEMKLSEYEKFQKLLNHSELDNSMSDHLNLYTKYLQNISQKKRSYLAQRYQHQLELIKFKVPMIAIQNSTNFTSQGVINVKH